jgi:hypothetical protein
MEKSENTYQVMTIENAATVLNTTVPKILMMIKNGALKGELVDGVWEIDVESICSCPSPQSVPHAKGNCGGCGGGCGSK